MAGDTRTRMVDAAVEALRRHGVAGMSFTEVLAASGAARGAIYHHFPGGKSELAAEAATQNGAQVRDHLAALSAEQPTTIIQAFMDAIRPVVAESALGAGCAVAAVAMDPGGDDPRLRGVAAGAFASWCAALTDRLVDAGVAPEEAGDLGTTLVVLLEGAHVLCRASGDLEPFDRAERAVAQLTTARYSIA